VDELTTLPISMVWIELKDWSQTKFQSMIIYVLVLI